MDWFPCSANCQGWHIFENEHAEPEIQRCDESGRFASDDEAASSAYREGLSALMVQFQQSGCDPVHLPASLLRYENAEHLRYATREELQASIQASEQDGGAGVIVIDGISCYVLE